MNFATAALDLRKSVGCTQRALARRLGITAVHLCNIEGGFSEPSKALCQRYEEVTGYDLYVWAWNMMHGKESE